MDNPISVRNISVAYDFTSILDEVSFEVKSGEFIAIVGKSGSGKTTLLNTIAGFIDHTGTIASRGKIGFCFQNHCLFYWMTVAENIAFGLDERNTVDRQAAIRGILQKIDMSDHHDKYPGELSGGQVQRVALGRAIAGKPAILLLDEPFCNLDIYTRDQMMDWVLAIIADTGSTVLMVTHYLDEALVLADRIFVLRDKKIQQEIEVPFGKPRTQQIRFTEAFQERKLELATILNQP